jgi:hypothetical protein
MKVDYSSILYVTIPHEIIKCKFLDKDFDCISHWSIRVACCIHLIVFDLISRERDVVLRDMMLCGLVSPC